jgi:hypothetical protein
MIHCSVCWSNDKIEKEAIGYFASPLGPFSQAYCQDCIDSGRECISDVDYILYPELRNDPVGFPKIDMGSIFLRRAKYYKKNGSFKGYDAENEWKNEEA